MIRSLVALAGMWLLLGASCPSQSPPDPSGKKTLDVRLHSLINSSGAASQATEQQWRDAQAIWSQCEFDHQRPIDLIFTHLNNRLNRTGRDESNSPVLLGEEFWDLIDPNGFPTNENFAVVRNDRKSEASGADIFFTQLVAQVTLPGWRQANGITKRFENVSFVRTESSPYYQFPAARTTLAHEIGHILGLGDERFDTNNLMYGELPHGLVLNSQQCNFAYGSGFLTSSF